MSMDLEYESNKQFRFAARELLFMLGIAVIFVTIVMLTFA